VITRRVREEATSGHGEGIGSSYEGEGRTVIMGTVIRRTAAAEDIMSDLALTLTRARARGGAWQTHAEARVAPVQVLGEGLAMQLGQAQRELVPLMAARDAADDVADDGIGLIMDEIWNRLGRPGSDPMLSIVFPGGIRHYTEGDTDQQPHRMELLAGLLEAGALTKLGAEQSKALAQRVRELAAPLKEAAEKTTAPRARVDLLKSEINALARVGQTELVHLKRLYKSEGFSEADIHTVIPDRTPSTKSKSSAAESTVSAGGASDGAAGS
jgi:hypothetical protein